MTAPFVAAIVLAAGESTRMGTQKALLPWEGVPLIEYQLAQLAGVEEVMQIVVVTGHAPEEIRRITEQRAVIAPNPRYAEGKVSSILAGLNAISSEATSILLLAVDQPRPARVLRTIVQRHLAERAGITVPVHEGRRGHPVVFDRALLPELRGIDEASEGIRAVLRRHRAETLEVSCENPIVLIDLNRPSDVTARDEDIRRLRVDA